jgi:hypothetical protein
MEPYESSPVNTGNPKGWHKPGDSKNPNFVLSVKFCQTPLGAICMKAL